MANYLKGILDYVKNMTFYAQKNKERIIVNISEGLEIQIREICQILREEKIVIILDDSQWNNLQEVVVFTDKNIYWHMKDAYMRIKEENSEITVKGYGLINNKDLSVASVFSKVLNKIKYIYIISSNLRIILPFKNIEIENSLTLTFYDYISMHGGRYKPDTIENEKIFRIISEDSYNNNGMVIKNKKSLFSRIIKKIFKVIIVIGIIFILLCFINIWLICSGVLDLNKINNILNKY